MLGCAKRSIFYFILFYFGRYRKHWLPQRQVQLCYEANSQALLLRHRLIGDPPFSHTDGHMGLKKEDGNHPEDALAC